MAARERLWTQAWVALGEAGEAQAEQLRTAEPTTRFLELLRSALSSGEAHLADDEGRRQQDSPEAWGWRGKTVYAAGDTWTDWQPQGKRIGWIRGEDVYLEPAAAFAAVQRLGHASGETFSVGLPTLERRFFQHGLLASIEMKGKERRLRRRIVLEGKRRAILHFLRASLFPEPDQSAKSAQFSVSGAGLNSGNPLRGPETWSGNQADEEEPDHKTGPMQPNFGFSNPAPGPSGPVGPVSTQETAYVLGDETPALSVRGRKRWQHERQVHGGKAVEWWQHEEGTDVCGVCHPRPKA